MALQDSNLGSLSRESNALATVTLVHVSMCLALYSQYNTFVSQLAR